MSMGKQVIKFAYTSNRDSIEFVYFVKPRLRSVKTHWPLDILLKNAFSRFSPGGFLVTVVL